MDITAVYLYPVKAMAADLRKKIFHAEEVYEQASSILRDFSCQSWQLQDAISHMAEQLDTVESTLSELSRSSDPENVAKIKVRLFHLHHRDLLVLLNTVLLTHAAHRAALPPVILTPVTVITFHSTKIRDFYL